MKFSSIIEFAAKNVSKANIKIQKHSPEILIVVGVAGVVASTVIACRATLKANDILEETVEEKKELNAAEISEEHTSIDHKKEVAVFYAQTGAKFVKLYGPAVVLGGISIACIVGSNDILRKRNAALVTAYAMLDSSFNNYREKVVEKFGKDIDQQLKCGLTEKDIPVEEVDQGTGEVRTVNKKSNVAKIDSSDFTTFFFDENTSYCYEEDSDYNMMFLKMKQEYVNQKFKIDGYMFLGTIYEELGIKTTPEQVKAGQVIGWVYDPSNKAIDNYIDFGAQKVLRDKEDGSYEDVIVLDINVDGTILDKI